MSDIDPTKPPVPVQTPEEVLAAFWQAKQARDWWADEEKRLRLALSDMYCVDPAHGGYKSRTLDLGNGMKLEFTVTRKLQVDTKNPYYVEWHKNAGTEKINKIFRTKPATLETYLTGYNSLDDADKQAIAPAVTFAESISASFKAPKDER